MKPKDVNLGSVNWEHGMLLTPDHFLRQEKYTDSALLWILRYTTSRFGLVGGGPRIPENERGAVRNDPIVVVDEDDEYLRLAVTQCRGLTPAGCIIEVDSEHPLRARISKSDLNGAAYCPIYVTCEPHEKEVLDGEVDEFNPQMKTERRPAYRLGLHPDAEFIAYSVVVARLRKERHGAGYEKDPEFIPTCTAMCGFSELNAAWRKILENLNLLAKRYTELHRAMREFLVLFAERGIDTDVDTEAMRFVDRMVAVLQDCQYSTLDPAQSPQMFFNHLRRFFHAAAVYLDLTPAVQQYFDTLKETGETEFIAPLEQQKLVLDTAVKWEIHSDLGVEVRAGLRSLDSLQRLERALEGKYIDFRISSSLEAMNFIFDRGGKALYKLAARPAHVQGVGDERTIYFSQLRLEGRDKYRLILVGEANAVFEVGEKVAVDIRINEGSGFRRQPLIVSCKVTNTEQRNFEVDFDAPDVPTITDLKISLQAHLPIRTALLFTRHRFFAGRTQTPRDAVEPAKVPFEPSIPEAAVVDHEMPAKRVSRLERNPEPTAEPPGADPGAPWESPAPPPRRRRLE
jgi:hypothetical protein